MSTRAAALAALLVSVPVLAATTAPVPPEPAVFFSREGRFKAKFFGKVQELTEKRGGLDVKMYATEKPDGAYAVVVLDLPFLAGQTDEAVQGLLDAMRDGMVQSLGAKLQDSKRVTLDKKHPGREFSVTFEKPKAGTGEAFSVTLNLPEDGVLRARVYLVGDRVYTILAAGKKDFPTSREADAFFESFQLTEAPPKPEPPPPSPFPESPRPGGPPPPS